MDALQAALQTKTLEQLGELEELVKRDFQQQSEIDKTLKEIEELKSRVRELKRKRDHLQQKLKHLPTDSLRARILKDVAVKDVPASSLPVELQREIVLKAARQEKKRQYEYILVAHRCAGTTASVVERERGVRSVRVRFETSYKGEYFEPYYLELEFVGRRIKASWYTIPVFVPLTNLIEKYNKNEIHFTTMLYVLHTYLIAYVQRRQQTVELTSKYPEYLQEEIASYCAYNFIQLVLAIPSGDAAPQLVVHLHYRDLLSDLPSKVRCSDPECLPVDRARIKRAFMTLPITEAFQNLFMDQNIEQG